jgi:peptidyl-prolyl cis-trans isomerase C
MKKAVFVAMAVVLAVLAWGCEPPKTQTGAKPKSGKVLATVGKETITLEEFQERVNKQNPYLRSRFADQAKRKEYLDSMVRNEVLYQEAVRLGYDKDSDILERMKNEMVQRLINKEFDEKMKDSLVPKDEIKKYYEEHSSEYNKPEAVWVKIVLAKDQQKAQAALKDARAKADDQNYFVELVKKYSEDDKTNKIGGDVTYKTREEIEKDYGKDLADAAFAMEKVGEVSTKVVGAKGGPYFVLRLQGKRPAQHRTLEQVESQVKNRLFYEKRNQAFDKWVADLIAKAGVTKNEAILAEVKVEAPASGSGHGGPGSLPPGHPAVRPGARPGEGPAPNIKITPVQPGGAPQGK